MEKKYGRPKKSLEDKRSKIRKISYTPSEEIIINEKAHLAGTNATEWIRSASLERQPKSKRVILKLNQKAFWEICKFIEIANEKLSEFENGGKEKLYKNLLDLKIKIEEIQNNLIGEDI